MFRPRRRCLAEQLGGQRVAQHVRAELDPGAGPQSGDKPVNRLVAHLLPAGLGEQVDEHVVAVGLAVLLEHVRGVKAHQAAVIGMVATSDTLARAPFALSARATISSSRRWDTKSAWRNSSAWPMRIPVSRRPLSQGRVGSRAHVDGRALPLVDQLPHDMRGKGTKDIEVLPTDGW